MKNNNENVVQFIDINKAIALALETLGLRSNLDDICFVRSLIDVNLVIGFVNSQPELMIDCPREGINIERLSLLILEEIHKIHTDLILPYNFYRHELLEDEAIELICHKLKRYDLRAEKPVVQQMTWKTMNIFYTNDQIETWDHAANIVIKIYKKGAWFFPTGCPESFENRKSIQDL